MARWGVRAVEVEGGWWMVLRLRDGVLLRDLGWFATRAAAEARARELERLLGGVRRGSPLRRAELKRTVDTGRRRALRAHPLAPPQEPHTTSARERVE